MTDREIADCVFETSKLTMEDYFTSSLFYYLAGRFPDLTISRCADVANLIRKSVHN